MDRKLFQGVCLFVTFKFKFKCFICHIHDHVVKCKKL